jgi:hypothetical protein
MLRSDEWLCMFVYGYCYDYECVYYYQGGNFSLYYGVIHRGKLNLYADKNKYIDGEDMVTSIDLKDLKVSLENNKVSTISVLGQVSL